MQAVESEGSVDRGVAAFGRSMKLELRLRLGKPPCRLSSRRRGVNSANRHEARMSDLQNMRKTLRKRESFLYL